MSRTRKAFLPLNNKISNFKNGRRLWQRSLGRYTNDLEAQEIWAMSFIVGERKAPGRYLLTLLHGRQQWSSGKCWWGGWGTSEISHSWGNCRMVQAYSRLASYCLALFFPCHVHTLFKILLCQRNREAFEVRLPAWSWSCPINYTGQGVPKKDWRSTHVRNLKLALPYIRAFLSTASRNAPAWSGEHSGRDS